MSKLRKIENITHVDDSTVLMFDMDGTLVHTDVLNFLSYKEAILSVIEVRQKLFYKRNNRFNREALKKIAPKLTDKEYKEILKRKKKIYSENLHTTRVNKKVLDVLMRFYKTNRVVLVTNSRRSRAIETLIYHKIKDKFDDFICRNDTYKVTNKYQNALSYLGIDTDNVLVFENERQEVDKAINAGILINNIFLTFYNMNYFIISSNKYLNKDIKGFYNCYYTKYKKNNMIDNYPLYLLTLKNDGQEPWKQAKLKPAQKELSTVLLADLPLILEKVNKQQLTVCVIPRAKKDDYYASNQLLFRETVEDTLKQIANGFVNGIAFIQRHTNTKTTHLRIKSENLQNDGLEPYVGISSETCHFSENIKGKDILLIDDIYTKSVNIAEDMIQALLNKGANSVVFYAVAKTI